MQHGGKDSIVALSVTKAMPENEKSAHILSTILDGDGNQSIYV